MRSLVIQVVYGGLGDHLLFSHIPRSAKQSGRYDRVFISNLSPYRCLETRKLVWESNPFVDGFTDSEGVKFEPFSSVPNDMNLLDWKMLLHGIDDGVRFHEPEVYAPIFLDSKYSEEILYDPNYISNAGSISSDDVKGVFEKRKLRISHKFLPLPGHNRIEYDCEVLPKLSLYEFCTAVKSCAKLICLTTGTATLAAALNKPVLVLYGSPFNTMFHHSRIHEYVDVRR